MAFVLGGDSMITKCGSPTEALKWYSSYFFLTSPEGIQALIAASGDAELLVRLGMCNRRSRWLTNLDWWC